MAGLSTLPSPLLRSPATGPGRTFFLLDPDRLPLVWTRHMIEEVPLPLFSCSRKNAPPSPFLRCKRDAPPSLLLLELYEKDNVLDPPLFFPFPLAEVRGHPSPPLLSFFVEETVRALFLPSTTGVGERPFFLICPKSVSELPLLCSPLRSRLFLFLLLEGTEEGPICVSLSHRLISLFLPFFRRERCPGPLLHEETAGFFCISRQAAGEADRRPFFFLSFPLPLFEGRG